MNTNTVTGRVTHVQRLGPTYYGNPMMAITLDDHEVYRISNDAAMVYEVENREFREEPHTFALTRAGRISHVERGGRDEDDEIDGDGMKLGDTAWREGEE